MVIGDILLLTPTVWGAVEFSALSIPIYIYRKTLDKLMCHHGMRYHHYIDDTQLYISGPGKLRNSVDVISWCLGVPEVWMRHKRLHWSSGKMEWLWVWGLPIWVLYHLSSWVELHCPKQTQYAIWGSAWRSSWTHDSCLNNRWESWLEGPLHNFMLCPSCTHVWIGRLCLWSCML